jgi:hypothetical protein
MLCDEVLGSCLIDVREKPIVMRDLHFMGIDERFAFPGLDGLCRSMRDRFMCPPEVGETQPEKAKKWSSYLLAATKPLDQAPPSSEAPARDPAGVRDQHVLPNDSPAAGTPTCRRVSERGVP